MDHAPQLQVVGGRDYETELSKYGFCSGNKEVLSYVVRTYVGKKEGNKIQ